MEDRVGWKTGQDGRQGRSMWKISLNNRTSEHGRELLEIRKKFQKQMRWW